MLRMGREINAYKRKLIEPIEMERVGKLKVGSKGHML